MTFTTDQIRTFLINTDLLDPDDEIGDDDSLFESGVVDSLAVVEIVEYFKSDLGVTVPEADLVPENFDSFNAMAAYVERRKAS